MDTDLKCGRMMHSAYTNLLIIMIMQSMTRLQFWQKEIVLSVANKHLRDVLLVVHHIIYLLHSAQFWLRS
jgi:hypothetical protein